MRLVKLMWGKRVIAYVYIPDPHLNLLRGLEISSVLNPLTSQLTDSSVLLPTTIHRTIRPFSE
jgi:hypothetical protein